MQLQSKVQRTDPQHSFKSKTEPSNVYGYPINRLSQELQCRSSLEPQQLVFVAKLNRADVELVDPDKLDWEQASRGEQGGTNQQECLAAHAVHPQMVTAAEWFGLEFKLDGLCFEKKMLLYCIV